MTVLKLFRRTKQKVRSYNTWRTTRHGQMKKKNVSQKWVCS
nr:MAG TPA: hypothetical protein [Caudoviricetes sp.]